MDARIVIVDDEPEENTLIYTRVLEQAGYTNLEFVKSVDLLVELLNGSVDPGQQDVDLILMDVLMPGKDGIEGIYQVKQYELFKDIPIVMLSASDDKQLLKKAFEAGALDYITKPVDMIELNARVGSALRLNEELKQRKMWEKELLDMTRSLMSNNAKLEQASFLDPVTGLLNRKAFDKRLQEDWIHAYVQKSEIGLILVQINDFASFNEQKGAVQGDACLVLISDALQPFVKERGLLARFGGTLFALLYPAYTESEVKPLVADIEKAVEKLAIEHADSNTGVVNVSLGFAMVDPAEAPGPMVLLQAADLDLATEKLDEALDAEMRDAEMREA